MALLLVARSPAGPDPAPFRLEEGRISIGRSPECDWTLPDPTQQISARHCEIAWVRDGYAVADVSTNGTLLNGERLTAARRLGDGDVLTVGGYRIAVTTPAAAAAAATSPGPAAGSDELPRALAIALGTLLATRARQRREIGVREGGHSANGPLAQADGWAALAALPAADARRAVEDAVAAIDRHNAAALMAMQQALRDLIAAIGPEAVTRSAAPRPGLDDDQRDAALWRAFVARYTGRAGGEDFPARFAGLFRDAYARLAERA